MKIRKWFWGLFCIGAAALIVAHQLGYLAAGIGLWSLIITVLLVPVIIESIIAVNFPGILFPLAFLTMIYAKPLGLERLQLWPLLLIALLLSVGLSLLFRPRKSWCTKMHDKYRHNAKDGCLPATDEESVSEDAEGDEIICETTFGEGTKYLHSDRLKRVIARCSFGALKLYFDDVLPAGKQIELQLDASFSGVSVFIPRDWQVKNSLSPFMGGVSEKHRNTPKADAPILLLTGRLSLSGVEIWYI